MSGVRERRKAKFHWQAPDEIEHIRYEWQPSSPSASVGLGVWRALTELATEDKARTAIGTGSDSERFKASQKEIAARAVVSDRSAARACDELERIGLLAIETDRDGENRPGRPSYYVLLDPPATYERVEIPATSERGSYVKVIQRRNPVQTTSEAVSDVPAEGANSVRTSPYKGKKEKQKKEEGDGDHGPVTESTKATTAWTDAKQMLAARFRGERFDTYIRPLEVAGERDGRLVLLDSSEQGGGEWIGEVRPLILEALADFDDFEILDETELDRAGLIAATSTATVNPVAAAPAHIGEAKPAVVAALGRISEVKQCPFPDDARVVAAMATYPSVDHRAVASDMEDRLLVGTWKSREVKDVVAMYRSFLKREQQSASERPASGRQRGGEHPADARIREIRERRAAGDVIDAEAMEER